MGNRIIELIILQSRSFRAAFFVGSRAVQHNFSTTLFPLAIALQKAVLNTYFRQVISVKIKYEYRIRNHRNHPHSN